MIDILEKDLAWLNQKIDEFSGYERSWPYKIRSSRPVRNMPWGGAGVIVCFERPQNYGSQDVIVESPMAYIIANMLRRLKKNIKSLNYFNKYEFYMRVAQGLLDSDALASVYAEDVQQRMLLEAHRVLVEWASNN